MRVRIRAFAHGVIATDAGTEDSEDRVAYTEVQPPR